MLAHSPISTKKKSWFHLACKKCISGFQPEVFNIIDFLFLLSEHLQWDSRSEIQSCFSCFHPFCTAPPATSQNRLLPTAQHVPVASTPPLVQPRSHLFQLRQLFVPRFHSACQMRRLTSNFQGNDVVMITTPVKFDTADCSNFCPPKFCQDVLRYCGASNVVWLFSSCKSVRSCTIEPFKSC